MTLQSSNEFFYTPAPNEKPLDYYPADGGFCSIFRTVSCIGDSLSSGEFESVDEQGRRSYHDFYDYSWGQNLARIAGCRVYNFSRGGMTARAYCENFADANGLWSPDKACQAYIIALGVNDLYGLRGEKEVGSLSDVDWNDWHNNKPNFAGFYGEIIARYREIQPKARFFLMTIPRETSVTDPKLTARADEHAVLLHAIAEAVPFTYVLDFRRYAPVYDEAFKERFYLHGHMNPAGYILTARMTVSYIDYIIRHNMKAFRQAGFIGTPFYRDNLDEAEEGER